MNNHNGIRTCLEQLDEAAKILELAWTTVLENNQNGQQFDYCNCSELSTKIERVCALADKISNTVYQNN